MGHCGLHGTSRMRPCRFDREPAARMDTNLHAPHHRLIELQLEHADLDATIDQLEPHCGDELLLRRLKKKRLAMRDEIARLEREVMPCDPA